MPRLSIPRASFVGFIFLWIFLRVTWDLLRLLLRRGRLWRRVRRMRELTMMDRFGIGWRPELAAGILCNLQDIDVVEVIAEDYFSVPQSQGTGPANIVQTGSRRPSRCVSRDGVGRSCRSQAAGQLARLVETIRPESWSEHLAFVRGGGYEIGHLAAPPRTAATIEGAAQELRFGPAYCRSFARCREYCQPDRPSRQPLRRAGLDFRDSLLVRH